jgi:hypothetical protein
LRDASQIPNSDQSPLYDVRNPAPVSVKDNAREVMFSRTILLRHSSINDQPAFALSSHAGHASPFGSATATRSPKGEAWWSQTGSNRRPHACKARALPAELWPRTRRRMPLLRPSPPVGLRRARFAFVYVATPRVADGEAWWAWEDLNFRPHAYQARALTN